MQNLINIVTRFSENKDVKDNLIATSLEGLSIVYFQSPTTTQPVVYTPTLCLILQGCKEARIGSRRLQLHPGQAIVVSHVVPIMVCVTEASLEKPYLALLLNLDMNVLRSLYKNVTAFAGQASHHVQDQTPKALEVGYADADLIDALRRLCLLVDAPLDAKILAPLVMREIYYRLILADHGAMLRCMLWKGSHANLISRTITHIQERYTVPLNTSKLADIAGMSPSSFHAHFKAITGTTPLQYQKDLRLLHAQRHLMEGSYSVTAAAFEVGYESLTQFSREYTRKFGASPKHDFLKI
ncbi:MAG: AraC family transcriptional regulator [Robiginitomaculum sp.]|nr:MAG: AraC family transcriptional regulator [Robiginitomaculum sp.]